MWTNAVIFIDRERERVEKKSGAMRAATTRYMYIVWLPNAYWINYYRITWMLFCIKLLLLLTFIVYDIRCLLPFKSQLVAFCQCLCLSTSIHLTFLYSLNLATTDDTCRWMLAKRKIDRMLLIRISTAHKLDQSIWMHCIAESRISFLFVPMESWIEPRRHSDDVPVHHLCIMRYTFDTC